MTFRRPTIEEAIAALYDAADVAQPTAARCVTPLRGMTELYLLGCNLRCYELDALTGRRAANFLLRRGGLAEAPPDAGDEPLAGFIHAGRRFGAIFVEQGDLVVRRRFIKLVLEGNGVLRRYDLRGNPLSVALSTTSDPVVIDLNALARTPSLQRFVVATIFRQLIEARTGTRAVRGLRYVVALDELNRFAPRGSRDPVTRLIESVAAEMRSQGVILLGAEQQASKVSETVIENAAIRALGCSGSLELAQPVWRFLSDGARRKAASLPVTEKLVIQDNFREPMQVRVPFPAWAMRREEAVLPAGGEDFSDIIDE